MSALRRINKYCFRCFQFFLVVSNRSFSGKKKQRSSRYKSEESNARRLRHKRRKKREGPAYPERTLDKLHLEASTKFCLSRSPFFFLLLLLLSFNFGWCYFISINNARMVSMCWNKLWRRKKNIWLVIDNNFFYIYPFLLNHCCANKISIGTY